MPLRDWQKRSALLITTAVQYPNTIIAAQNWGNGVCQFESLVRVNQRALFCSAIFPETKSASLLLPRWDFTWLKCHRPRASYGVLTLPIFKLGSINTAGCKRTSFGFVPRKSTAISAGVDPSPIRLSSFWGTGAEQGPALWHSIRVAGVCRIRANPCHCQMRCPEAGPPAQ